MPSRNPIRLLPALCLGLSFLCPGLAAHAQSPNGAPGVPPGRQFGENLILPSPQPQPPPAPGLPPTQPTMQQPVQQPAQQPQPVPPVTLQPAYVTPRSPAHRARVTFTAGQLLITADNSSLNQILRDVGRQTGVLISGGVKEDRVYGTYGPADTGTVLSALLLGSGTNFLLVQHTPGTPHELILTPRVGGASPPTPVQMRSSEDDDADLPPTQQLPPRLINTPGPPATPPPPASVESTLPQPPTQAPAAATNNTSAATPDPSPNGVKTPQQIYDQLMKLQAQKLAGKQPQ